jgi:hypothetical protein
VRGGGEVRCGKEFETGGDGEAYAVNPAVRAGREHRLSPYLEAKFGGEVGEEVEVALADSSCRLCGWLVDTGFPFTRCFGQVPVRV